MCNLTDEEGKRIPVTVIEYVVNDLKEDELAFHNPLHRQMLRKLLRICMIPISLLNVISWHILIL